MLTKRMASVLSACRLAIFCGLVTPAVAQGQIAVPTEMTPGAMSAPVSVAELTPNGAVIAQLQSAPGTGPGYLQPAPGNGPAYGSTASPAPGAMPPISLRPVEYLRRDLESLAARHNMPPPAPVLLTRDALGEYFLVLLKRLSALPRERLTNQDYDDIGLLTEEFDRAFRVMKGKIALSTLRAEEELPPEKQALPLEMQKFGDRFSALERVKLSGDMVFMPQNDFGRSVPDSMAANFRGRINVTAKVVDDDKNSMLGDGFLFARLTAASGRFFPRNKFLMATTNDINDAVANPYNSGVNEVQVPSLIINNNNSNSVRPTVSMEQAYYTQDLKFGTRTKGNFKAGLIYMGNMFDNNNYANSEYLQFFNVAFVNSVSWRPNYIGPSFVASVERSILRDKAFLRATAGVVSITDRDYWGNFSQNYEAQIGHRFFNKEGNLRAGVWTHDFRSGTSVPFVSPPDALTASNALPLIPGGTNFGSRPMGFYLNADQKVWKDIGLFGRYALNDKQIGEVFLGGLLSSRQSYSFGAEIPAKLLMKKRTNDVIGIAYGHVSPYNRDGAITPATPAFVAVNGVPATNVAEVNRNLAIINTGTTQRDEKILECYYRYQINKNVSISPDFQYIWCPGGTGPQPGIMVLGTRLTVTF